MADATSSWWSRTYGVASWTLIGLFALLAAAHVVLTVLYYTGVHDTGVGYVFEWELPAWLITVIDATVAWLLWFAYRRGVERPGLGLIATIAAAITALARAAWMVFMPVLLVVAIAGSVLRIIRFRPATRSPNTAP